jgi:anti-anti-sigma factor
MPVKCEEYSQVCVIEVDGDFTGDNTLTTRHCFEEYLEQKQITHFVMHLSKTHAIDSRGLETLLHMKRRCEDRLGQFKLAALSPTLQTVLQITRLEHRFDCQEDLTTAVKTMR